MLNHSRTMHAARLYPIDRMLAVLILLLLTLVAPVGAEQSSDRRLTAPASCDVLQVPHGSRLVFRAYASGVQVYRWNGTSWIFVEPVAALFADNGGAGTIGIHYAGPTWQSVSGSKVVGVVRERCTPDPDAIPWLLLDAVADDGPGIFHRVTLIQRLNTVGGKAPATPGNAIGDEASVAYTADYLFYRAP